MQNFKEYIQGNEPTLVEFYASWCSSCKKVRNVVEEFEVSAGGKANVLRLDVDAGINAAKVQEYKVAEVPTLILFKAGEVVWRNQGVISVQELKEVFESIR